MTLKDDKGNDVQITVNDRLAITRADEISKEIDGILVADKIRIKMMIRQQKAVPETLRSVLFVLLIKILF